MRRIIRLFLLFLLASVPVPVWALVAGYVTDTSGVPTAVRDVPKRGETPGGVHARYCAEPMTLANVRTSILTPNRIRSDRLMQAGKAIDVRCRELKESWKSAGHLSPAAKEYLDQLQGKIDTLETSVREMKGRFEHVVVVTDRIAVVSGATSPEEWWSFLKSHRFWQYVFFCAIILLLVWVLEALGRAGMTAMRRGSVPVRVSSVVSTGRPEEWGAMPQEEHDVVRRIGDMVQATVHVDNLNVNVRKFQYTVQPGPDGKCPSLRRDVSGGVIYLPENELLSDVHATLGRCLNAPFSRENADLLRAVARALDDGSLVEIT